ncbi:MAG: MarR family transcriptional regulator [Firmicutes bacterium]|nr:MarR family transcriptional regulator [Bacillota bacterium]
MGQEAELFQRIFGLVRSFEREFREQGANDLSTTQYEALLRLEAMQPITAMALAAMLRIKGPTATRALDSLVRRRYVVKERDPQDRRVVWLRMTEFGAEALARERLRHQQWVEEAAARLTPEERTQLLTLLQKMTLGSDDP